MTRKKSNQKQTKIINLFGVEVPLAVFLFLGFLTLATVYLTIQSASKGAGLLLVEDQIQALEKENRQLTTQLTQETSLTQITQQAEELGMIKPENVVYLTTEPPVAQLP